jgi:hypothetical protein
VSSHFDEIPAISSINLERFKIEYGIEIDNHNCEENWSRPFISMSNGFPEYFSLLSESDQSGYFSLRSQISSLTEKLQRGQRVAIFLETIGLIRTWTQRGDSDDWKRCLVCGLFDLPSGVAVNCHQLHFLTNKSKSALNGALKMIGYDTLSSRGDVNPDLIGALPILKGNPHHMRQWSVRHPTGNQESRTSPRKADPFNPWEEESCDFMAFM